MQPTYLEKHILAADPFVDLDLPAVGSMVQLAIRKCRTANAAAKVTVSKLCDNANFLIEHLTD